MNAKLHLNIIHFFKKYNLDNFFLYNNEGFSIHTLIAKSNQ